MDQSSIEAWPFESTKRSRLGQIGSWGSKRMTRFQSVYTSGASAMGVPGCPDLGCWTASIESVRMVLIDSWSNCSLVMGVTFGVRVQLVVLQVKPLCSGGADVARPG